MAMVSAEYRPMLKPGLKIRFELDGFHYEYSDLLATDISAEAVGTAEVQRLLGQERSDAVVLDPGAKVIVTAKLPSSTFSSEGRPYGYFDGLTGNAEVCVRSEPLLVTLIPALRQWLP
jgi:membrane fusion protein (multidrug efflux system)